MENFLQNPAIVIISDSGKIIFASEGWKSMISGGSLSASANEDYFIALEKLISEGRTRSQLREKIQSVVSESSTEESLEIVLSIFDYRYPYKWFITKADKKGSAIISHIPDPDRDQLYLAYRIIESFDEPLLILDPSGKTLYVDPIFKSQFLDPTIGSEIYSEIDRLFTDLSSVEKFKSIVQGNELGEMQTEMRNSSGRAFLASIRTYSVNATSGRKLGTAAQFQDITLKKLQEMALRESEAKYRALVEKIPAVAYIAELNKNRTLSYVSPRSYDIIGLEYQALINNPDSLYSVIHPDDRDRVISYRTNPDSTSYRIEYRILLKNNLLKWIRDEASLIYDENNQPIFIQGLLFDITESKESENALRKSEVRFRTLIQNIHEYIYSINYITPENPILYHSNKSKEITGYSPEDFYQEPELWNEMIFEEDSEKVSNFYLSLSTNGGVSSLEHRIIKKDGSLCWVSNTCAATADSDNRIKRLDGFILDITARKNLENELKSAIKIAKAANEKKSRFLATMSHDIRTPMHGVLGMTEILLKTEVDPMQKEFLEMIRTSGETLLNLLNDILDFTKIEAGKITFVKTEFDLHRTMKAILGPIHIQANEKQIQFRLEIQPDVPRYLVGDPHRFSQILNNLAGNSVNYTDSGAILVRVELDRNSDYDSKLREKALKVVLRFTVADTGVGIPKDRLGEIFESFNRLEDMDQLKPGGTGLGTTIARQLVELLGGHISVQSPTTLLHHIDGGPGTDFFFTLPFEFIPESNIKKVETGEHPEEDRVMRHFSEQLHILVAEDNEVNQVIIRKMIEKLGHKATIVSDGKQAIEQIESDHFDLVLMDLHMPVMDGFSASIEIRKKIGQSLPIYAVTADAYKEDLKKCNESGMSGYLIKPYKMDELRKLIESAISGETYDSSDDISY